MIHTTKSGPAKLQRVVTISDIKQVCSDSEGCPGRSWTFTIKTHSSKKPLVLQASSAETAATWVQLLSARLASHEERLQKHKIFDSGLGQAHAGAEASGDEDGGLGALDGHTAAGTASPEGEGIAAAVDHSTGAAVREAMCTGAAVSPAHNMVRVAVSLHV